MNFNNVVTQLHNPFLLLGDLNAHSSSWWRRQRLDRRGQKAEEFISAHNLKLFNKNQTTYFSLCYNTETAIDLAICVLLYLALGLTGTYIDSDIYNSDHYPILLHLTFQHDDISSFIPRWELDRADWIKFSELCETINLDHDDDDPEATVHHITDSIISTAKRSTYSVK